MHADDDHVSFLEEDTPLGPDAGSADVWRVLIVDDDDDVHQATEYALRDTVILGRNLHFLHAYNGDEAFAILQQDPEVAVVLLDVVMETEDAGLRTVGRIRDELGQKSVRIILRTGQPGYAPEIDAIGRYDINDYKTKAELTRNKLYTTITAAIRSFQQIQSLEASRRGLELIIDSSNRFIAEQGMQAFASGVITQISGLLGMPAEGLVCVQAQRKEAGSPVASTEDYIVLAATGGYQGMVNLRLGKIANSRIADALMQVLQSRKSEIARHGLTLFFPGKNGQDFAAYVECELPIRELDRHLLEVFCANIAICGDNVELVSRLRETAYVDALTGLPNRTAFIDAVDLQVEVGVPPRQVVVLVDIDQFSETIDMLGYRYGDSLLAAVAKRMRGALPADVYIARVGGDVFAVFGSEDVANPGVLREILVDPFEIEGGMQSVSISLGFVRLDSEAHSGADLLRNASIALKRAKSEGVGHEAYYTHEVAVETRERVRLLQQLRTAFSSDSLFVVYQPQIDLASGRVLGLEALLRWRTPEGSYVPPDRFIPVAEQSGLIVDLGIWVMRTAMRAGRSLHECAWRRWDSTISAWRSMSRPSSSGIRPSSRSLTTP
ncbi:MAG TPA: DUF3369 domain-containing protein [Rhodocyclaceae bacterium]|nr:DUF3369 domain-containing protein [Rhodocyclaceae bacterium]